ncbi:unnamed protein product [Gongylonema pulchrum]|uniref:Uncharacterized protein n=1 Tax=Gongylonema pulchrum TaxID=637853 RepID=A0A183EXV1_9BILA|nr:unnamed protein product [Gongylonema pulchrum]
MGVGICKGRSLQITMYLYNYSTDAAEAVYKVVANVLSWQNARWRLLREIGLHKMGITHLCGRIAPAGQHLIWLNGKLLSEYEIPQYGSSYFDKRYLNWAFIKQCICLSNTVLGLA